MSSTTKSYRWRIPCTLMRGGTSKAVILRDHDLPRDPQLRDVLVLRLFGSPDRRQIDGLGGADPLTSKVAIVGTPTRSDADVDYTFGQVEVNEAAIDYAGICGNLSSAVAAYAVQEGFARSKESVTHIRIHQTNTGGIIEGRVPTVDGQVLEDGDYAIAGVPGTGACISLDFSGNVGSVTGRLLPTGSPRDTFDIPGFGPLDVSVVDIANPMIFVRAEAFGVGPTEGPDDLDGRLELFASLETVRLAVAKQIGLKSVSTSFPLLSLIRPPASYAHHSTGQIVDRTSMDIWSRELVIGSIHKAHSATASACLAGAAVIPGTIVHDIVKPSGGAHATRIGHPSGVLHAEAVAKLRDNEVCIVSAIIGRTARRLMDGFVYAPMDVPQPTREPSPSLP